MDHLEVAKDAIKMTPHGKDMTLVAVAHALIALNERLDNLIDGGPNEADALRVVTYEG